MKDVVLVDSVGYFASGRCIKCYPVTPIIMVQWNIWNMAVLLEGSVPLP